HGQLTAPRPRATSPPSNTPNRAPQNCAPWPPTWKPSAAASRSSPTSATSGSPLPSPALSLGRFVICRLTESRRHCARVGDEREASHEGRSSALAGGAPAVLAGAV